MNAQYNDLYFKKLYADPLFVRLGLSKLYHLWFAYFCLIKKIHRMSKSKTFEIGCGVGNLVWALRQFGVTSYGWDPSIQAHKYCRVPKYCKYSTDKKIPYKDSNFDLVYSNEVLEHIKIDALPSFLNEAFRISKGITIHAVCTEERGDIAYSDPTHQIIKNEKWWKKKFTDLGYEVHTGNIYYFFPNFLPIITGKLKISGIKKGYFILYKNK